MFLAGTWSYTHTDSGQKKAEITAWENAGMTVCMFSRFSRVNHLNDAENFYIN
jgi:hypothetical protein